jgi:hypothetical protein
LPGEHRAIAVDGGEEERALVAEGVVEALPPDAHGLQQHRQRRARVAVAPEFVERAGEGFVPVEFLGAGHGASSGAEPAHYWIIQSRKIGLDDLKFFAPAPAA